MIIDSEIIAINECFLNILSGEEIPSKEEVTVKKEPQGGWVSTLHLRGIRLGDYGVSEVIVECLAANNELEKTTFSSHLVTIVSKCPKQL